MTRPATTADFVRHWANHRPDVVAIKWNAGSLTYRELDGRSNRVAQALLSEGVGPGDRVAYLDKNGPEHLELFFGAAKLNAVPCPVNFRLAPPEVAFIVNDSGAKVFVAGSDFSATVVGGATALPHAKIILTGTPYESWRDAHDPIDPKEPQAPGDVCFQLYSSGTTGAPKGVQLTQANILADLTFFPEALEFGAESVSIVAMPLYHVGGGAWALLGLWSGATNVLVRDIVPDQLVGTIVEERATHALLVPAMLQSLLAVPGIGENDFSSLKYVLYGASPISETVLSNCIRTFKCSFVQGFGLTETTGTVLHLPASDHDLDGPNKHRLRAVGVPVPGTEAKVVDPATGELVAPNEVGEIWVNGPTVMLGYWNLPEQTAAAITPDGWLRTGDAGYQDADGYFYIHDRLKDMIVTGGENVYPAEVENAIMSHPDVADAAVFGIPSEKWGETPIAVVVRRSDSRLTEQELIAHCRERLAGFKCPTRVDWTEQLPRNPSGKVLKRELRSPYWVGRDRNVG